MINEADKRSLLTPAELRAALDRIPRRPGVGALRALLDRQTFVLTESELERCFKLLVRRAGLPLPETRVHVSGYRVDFLWPQIRLVVETDGGTFHRTPSQQLRDRRDQAHLVSGLTPVRFTHSQVKFEPRCTSPPLCERLRAGSCSQGS